MMDVALVTLPLARRYHHRYNAVKDTLRPCRQVTTRRAAMQCPSCAFENQAGMNFCGRCGTRLANPCASCGFDNPSDHAFCGNCGTPLDRSTATLSPPAPQAQSSLEADPLSYIPPYLAEKILPSRRALEGERKQVTVLFADIKDSTELIKDLDPEDAQKLLDPAIHIMMDAVHRFEGTVNQVLGDGIMALFGAPIAHEDHAARACYPGLFMSVRGEAVRCASDRAAHSNERRRHTRRYVESRSASTDRDGAQMAAAVE
jgi:hypothetical protein